MTTTTCRCFDIGRRECLCHEYTATCTVSDDRLPVWERTTCPNPARPHPWLGAGIAVCFAHEMDRGVHTQSYRGTTRVCIPEDES